jgi:hypothetical protein
MRTAPGTIGRNNPTIPPSTRIQPRAKRAVRRSVICTCAGSVSCISDLLKRSTTRFLAVASPSAASIEGNVTGGYPCEKVFRDSNLATSGATPACRTNKSKMQQVSDARAVPRLRTCTAAIIRVAHRLGSQCILRTALDPLMSKMIEIGGFVML